MALTAAESHLLSQSADIDYTAIDKGKIGHFKSFQTIVPLLDACI